MTNPFEAIEARLINIESALNTVVKNSDQKTVVPEQDDQLLTVEQAAKFTHLSPQTIYRNVCHQTIPFWKNSRRLYFTKKALTDWIKSGQKIPVTEQPPVITPGKKSLRRGARK
jgi:excisionase family DNA binding protein